MKVLIGAAAAVLLMAATASAQTTTAPVTPAAPVPPSTCAAVPAAPTLPDGHTADAAAMNAANTTFQTWAAAYNAAMACRRAEVDGLRAQVTARTEEFNAVAAAGNTTNTSWQASVAAFNERSPAASRNRNSASSRHPTAN